MSGEILYGGVAMNVSLRRVEDADLDQLFEWERHPGAVAMAAFTRAGPSDRAAFDQHYARIRNDSDCMLLAIEDHGAFVGTIGSFAMEREREVTYWIDPARWGRGLASAALDAFVCVEMTRPLFARAAEHNVGSATVLKRASFVQVGCETAYADGVGRDVVERPSRPGTSPGPGPPRPIRFGSSNSAEMSCETRTIGCSCCLVDRNCRKSHPPRSQEHSCVTTRLNDHISGGPVSELGVPRVIGVAAGR